jgi:flavin prenyltransferase
MKDRIVVAISGASGVIYGIRLLQVLHAMPEIETHLVMSAAAKQTIAAETDWSIQDVEALAHTTYDVRQIGAAIASGSFATRGMIVVPCSIKSLSAIANSYSADLIARAADVTLKEGRPLILVVRETPLHLGHLRLMERAAEMGAVIFPPVPAFYGRPQTINEIIDGTVGRVLARLGLDNDLFTRWQGMRAAAVETAPVEAQDGEAALYDFLSQQSTLTLATTNPDGTAHACDVFYARADKTPFYFLSDPKTRHVENLTRDPRVSATIHGTARGWQDLRGAQLVGSATRVDDIAERARAFAFYLTKYAFVREMLPKVEMLGQVQRTFGLIDLYKFTPRQIRWIDNSQGFGHKEEFEIQN